MSAAASCEKQLKDKLPETTKLSAVCARVFWTDARDFPDELYGNTRRQMVGTRTIYTVQWL